MAWLLCCATLGLADDRNATADAATPLSADAATDDAKPAASQDRPPNVYERFQRTDRLPEKLMQVGVVEKLDANVPLELGFINERGEAVTLGDYFPGDRPVVLILGYYACPRLCNLVLNGAADAIRDLGWVPGENFEVVTVSIDPDETPEIAMNKKQSYMEYLGDPKAGRGWHFLTGEEPAIQRLADATGFEYQWDDASNQYAHAAVLIILTPDGRISRYLYGIRYPTQTLRLSLVEAGEGKIGSSLEQILLYCFMFDPTRGEYTLVAMNLMRLAAVGTMIVVFGGILVALGREALRRKAAREAKSATPQTLA